jgi:hypothetical protein
MQAFIEYLRQKVGTITRGWELLLKPDARIDSDDLGLLPAMHALSPDEPRDPLAYT